MIVSDSKSIVDAVRESAFVKVMVVGFLMIVLLIPLSMIHGMIRERTSRRNDVVSEVSRTWSNPQVAGGFILSVPYTVTQTNDYGKPYTTEHVARFLPETLAIDGRLVPEFRHRSLFEVPVYTTHLTMSGTFRRPDLAALRIDESTARLHDAWLTIGVGDLRGVNQGVSVTWNGAALPTSPSIDPAGMGSQAIDVKVPGLAAPARPPRPTPPEALSGDPVRREDRPQGHAADQLPAGREDDDGAAGVDVAASGVRRGRSCRTRRGSARPGSTRNGGCRTWDAAIRRRGATRRCGPQQIEQAAVASRFGVQLITPVDIYHRAERSTKYGALFILLTFCTFFVVELLQRRRLHPVQYLLVGAALCLFYLLLLSLSEHIGFGRAYLSAAAATIGVIGMYAGHVLGGLWQGVRTVAGLSLLYGFLYVLLQLEDYALLVGSISLFLILAAVMYATRRVDWYAIGRPASPTRDRCSRSVGGLGHRTGVTLAVQPGLSINEWPRERSGNSRTPSWTIA